MITLLSVFATNIAIKFVITKRILKQLSLEVPNFWKDNSAESQPEPKNNFKYSRTESGIHIDKYVGRNVFISIPENIENLPVESIGYRAFENENLYKVVIPANVKSIVYCAFVSQQPMHVFFKGDSIKMIAQSFLVPKVTFYFINANIYDDIYQITKNDSKCNVSYNAADFDRA